jgi:metal-responsive CopG/Arc/MetJ family transcriptional regulator
MKPPYEIISITMPMELLISLDDLCYRTGRNRSRLIAEFVAAELERVRHGRQA